VEKQVKTTVLIALKAILRNLGFLLHIWKAIKMFSFFFWIDQTILTVLVCEVLNFTMNGK